MPRKTKPLTRWRGNRWTPLLHSTIEKRVVRRARAKIIEGTGLTEQAEIDALMRDVCQTLTRPGATAVTSMARP